MVWQCMAGYIVAFLLIEISRGGPLKTFKEAIPTKPSAGTSTNQVLK